MQPLYVLATIFALLVVPFGWWVALRVGLFGMFLMTGCAHWGKRRSDLIRMVPTALPRPDLLVTISGICELLGAFGLLFPRTAALAASGLALLLVAVFPANIRAAHEAILIAGRPATPLLPRTILQIVFLIAAIAVAVGAPR